MKILYFANGLSNKGGMERIVVDKVNYLANKKNYEVTVCVLNNNIQCFYPISDKIKILPLGGVNNIKKGIWQKLLRLITIHKKIKSVIKSNDFDIIVNAQTQLVTWLLPFIYTYIPKVMEIHFSHISMAYNIQDKGKLFKFFYFKIAEWIYGKYDKFIVLSETDKKYWPMKNVEVIYNFTNCKPQSINPDNRDNAIICIARYQKQKRIDLLIKVWKKLHNKYPQWHVDVYGTGPDKTELQQMINQYNLADSFFLHDAVDNVEAKYAESKIFALTSEHEGFGLVLIEAMNSCLPICAFNIIPIPEIIDNNNCGLLCDFPDIDKFAINLSSLIENKELRIQLGNNGQNRAKMFTANIIMEKWIKLFQSLQKENKQ